MSNMIIHLASWNSIPINGMFISCNDAFKKIDDNLMQRFSDMRTFRMTATNVDEVMLFFLGGKKQLLKKEVKKEKG